MLHPAVETIRLAMWLMSGLEFTLTQGLPQEKLVALRKCIEKIHTNKPSNEIKILIRELPTGNLQKIEHVEIGI